MKAIAELATALDLVKLRAADVLDADELEDVEDIADRVEERRGFFGNAFVVAIAGGTGAGKSSLLNAIAGADVASVSAVRPHTDQPLALIPEHPSLELTSFLDDMGISERAPQDRFVDLAVIDLPDQDSVAIGHRRLVWDILPEVDAIVWVSDPDKYHDATFLEDYVGGLVAYQDQALFVLNKSDLLSDDAAADVKADFAGQLETVGITEPTIFVVAAGPPHQDPLGTDELARHLEEKMEAKRVMASKTVADVARALELVTRRAGLERGGAVSYDQRWAATKAAAASSIADDDVVGAIGHVDDFVASLVVDVGSSFGRRLVAAAPPRHIEKEVSAAAAAAAMGARPVEPKRRGRRKSRDSDEAPAPLPALDLDASIGEPLRALLWDRAYLGATLAAASVEAAQAQALLTS